MAIKADINWYHGWDDRFWAAFDQNFPGKVDEKFPHRGYLLFSEAEWNLVQTLPGWGGEHESHPLVKLPDDYEPVII